MIQLTQALGNPRDCCQICSHQGKKPDMECRLPTPVQNCRLGCELEHEEEGLYCGQKSPALLSGRGRSSCGPQGRQGCTLKGFIQDTR